jgi:hypothetical protein
MSKVPSPTFPVVAEPGGPYVFGDNRTCVERAGRPPVARGFPRALPLTVPSSRTSDRPKAVSGWMQVRPEEGKRSQNPNGVQGRSQACARRQIAHRPAMVSLGMVINALMGGLLAIPGVSAGTAAVSIRTSRTHRLSNRSDRDPLVDWMESDNVWVGTARVTTRRAC